MTTNKISVNIWDDFYEDGYIPEGKIQKTFAYVESELNHEDSKSVLLLLEQEIKSLINDEKGIELDVSFYDSVKVYPNLVGTEHEHMLYKRWQLEIKHLTHKKLDWLVPQLVAKQLKYKDSLISMYSES